MYKVLYNYLILSNSLQEGLTMSKQSRDSEKRSSFKNVRRRYWRDKAKSFASSMVFSQENINRMKRGLPPRRLAAIRCKKTGDIIEYHAPIELHHVFPLNEERPIDEQAFVELYPWQHAAVDDSRHFNFEFVEWRSFQ
jgi:hypothetical protein